MSDKESGSCGLSGWALVNSQGEVESSDAESNTSSIEAFSSNQNPNEDFGTAGTRQSSPENIELEQLMREADMAELSTHQSGHAGENKEQLVAVPISDKGCQTSHGVSESGSGDQQLETEGACCAELLRSTARRLPAGEDGDDKKNEDGVTLPEMSREDRSVSPEHQDSDSSPSSASLLSLSGISSSLSSTSKSNSLDSDSESDFVRLEKESSVGNTESEEEEPGSSARTSPLSMAASGSSVCSGFNFLSPSAPASPCSNAPPIASSSLVEAQDQPVAALQPSPALPQRQAPQQDVEESPPPSPPPSPPVQQGDALPEPADPQAEEVDYEIAEQQQQGRHHPPPPPPPPPPAMNEDEMNQDENNISDDDADTESSAEDQDHEDERIESEQSDNPVQVDNVDLSILNDIGDVPVERGDVERHYIHCNNQQLNGRLNRVMLAVLVLALGMGLGHWIGSAREHFNQMEIQLAQMKRLHQIQDEYVQCLSRNDELLQNQDRTLQTERDRHSQAVDVLVDNNHQLQQQLQEAQDQLELLMTAMKAKTEKPSNCPQKPSDGPTKPSQGSTESSPESTTDPLSPVTMQDFLSLIRGMRRKAFENKREDTEKEISVLSEEIMKIFHENLEMEESISRLRQNPHAQVHPQIRKEEWFSFPHADCWLDCGDSRISEESELLKSLSSSYSNLFELMFGWRSDRDRSLEEHGWSREQKELLEKSHRLVRGFVREELRLELERGDKAERLHADKRRASDGHKIAVRQNRQLRQALQTLLSGAGDGATREEPTLIIPPPPNPVPPPPLVDSGLDGNRIQKDMDLEENDADVTVEVVEDDEFEEDVMGMNKKQDSRDEHDTGNERNTRDEHDTGDEHDTDLHKKLYTGKESAAKTSCSSSEVPKPVPMDALMLLQRNLTQERERSEMWRKLYLSQRSQQQHPINTTACLHHLRSQLNVSVLLQYLADMNLTSHGFYYYEFGNMSSLLDGVAQLQQNIVDALPVLWDELTSALQRFSRGGDDSPDAASNQHRRDRERPSSEKVYEGERERNSDERGGWRDRKGDEKKTKPGTGGGDEKTSGSDDKSGWSDGVKNLLNKTRGTLSNMSQQLHLTWGQVKNASQHWWPSDDSIVGRMAARVKNSITKISNKMHKKAFRWFQGRNKPKGAKGKKWSSPEEEEFHKPKKNKQDKAKPKENKHDRDRPKKNTKESHKQGKNRHGHNQPGKREWKRHQKEMKKHEQKLERRQKAMEKTWKRKHNQEMENKHKFNRKDDERQQQQQHNEAEKVVKQSVDSMQEIPLSQRPKLQKQQHVDMQAEPKEEEKEQVPKHPTYIKGKGSKEDEANKKPLHKNHDGKQYRDRKQDEHAEPQFTVKSKDHSSHPEVQASKTRVKLEQAFNKLFIKIGAFNENKFRSMDKDDREDMLELVMEISEKYGDGSQLGLPATGHRWLTCQTSFWKEADSVQYQFQPSADCTVYLAPWQQNIPHHVALQKDKFDDYDDGNDNTEDENDDIDYVHIRKKKPTNVSKANDEGKKSADAGAENKTENQHHEKDSSWYEQWAEGRNDLRSGEREADWVFDRAEHRDTARQEEHTADWMFDRAAERDATRESTEEDEEQRFIRTFGRRQFDNDHHYHPKDSDDEGSRGHHSQRDKKDFRQKYGRSG